MSHPSKFVSVNLNKSYGQPSGGGGGVGNARGRHGNHHGSSSSGGMVVLSRPRSSGSSAAVGAKGSLPRLAVPPPLNLPSLRKEHERSDPSARPGSSSGAAGGGSSTGSSTMGWTKPGILPQVAPLQEKDSTGGVLAGSSYVPPGVRSVPLASPARVVDKVVVLRGEDFPSLLATFASPVKHKDALDQKQKQKQGKEGEVQQFDRQVEKQEIDSHIHMRPQMRSSHAVARNGWDEGSEQGRPSGDLNQSQKKDGFPLGPLPLVRLPHTTDWADDERDTGLSIPERDRDHRLLRIDSSDGRGAFDAETGGASKRNYFGADSMKRDSLGSNNASSWRMTPPQQRNSFGSREVEIDRDRDGTRTVGETREAYKEIKYGGLHNSSETTRNEFSNGLQGSRYARRDFSLGMNIQNGPQPFNGRGSEQSLRGRYSGFPNNQFRGDAFQNSSSAKSPFSPRNKVFSLPIVNFSKERRSASSNGKPFIEDAVFESSDPFSVGLIGDVNTKVLKKKKDSLKQGDFYDPVRESFEAELERVQRMQEQERQRVLDEQAKALELARKEEEERERLVREEEERRRQLEEETREAAWRAEQERMEAARKVEELKIAKEEEKRRISMEEERRKEAARRKLLELEARIARRQTETSLKDSEVSATVRDDRAVGLIRERDVPRAADVGDWEDGERMVERLTSSASSNSSSMNRASETGSRPNSSMDGNFSFTDRGKNADYWRRDAYDNGSSSFISQDRHNEFRGLRRDVFGSGRGFPRKEFHGSPGLMSMRPFSKGGASESLQMRDDFRQFGGDSWNFGRDGEYFHRNTDVNAEFEFGDGGWDTSHSHGSPHAPYTDRFYQNSEVDGFPSIGRARHSSKQPRVLPPPLISSNYKGYFRAPADRSGSSSFTDDERRYQHVGRHDEPMQTVYDGYHERVRQSAVTPLLQENVIPAQLQEKDSPRCASQSSLSVSSPPSSPTQLSHDDFDESGDSPVLPSAAVGEIVVETDSEHMASSLKVGDNNAMPSTLVSHGENDEWGTGNNEEMQEQEEYDEEVDGYQEEDEAHEGDDENLDLAQEFEELQSDMQKTTGEMESLVLGFDDGVEVRVSSNDEFEKTLGSSENAVEIQEGPVDVLHSEIDDGGTNLQVESLSKAPVATSPSDLTNETVKVLQDLVLDPVISTSGPSENVLVNITGMPYSVVSSTLAVPATSSVQPILSSAPPVTSQPELPVSLQFGLFSGPSLIPSPVPAIQIGSIQMPLHLHPQVGPPISQVHPSQPPLFQFGQLRYTPPISQGVLPLAPQHMSFVHPPTSALYTLNQHLGGGLHNHTNEGSQNNRGQKMSCAPIDKQLGPLTRPADAPQDTADCKKLLNSSKADDLASYWQADSSTFIENKARNVSQSEGQKLNSAGIKKNYRPVASTKEPQFGMHGQSNSSQFSPGEKGTNGSRAPGISSGSRGKRAAYIVRNSGTRSYFPGMATSDPNSTTFQRGARRNFRRTEFRVWENVDRRQAELVEPSGYVGQEEKQSPYGRSSWTSGRFGVKNDAALNRSSMMVAESGNLKSVASSSQFGSSTDKSKPSGKEMVYKGRLSSIDSKHAEEGNLKRNATSEEDVDAPLQSGVVRVFNQPGIEAPSDGDGFIEVRSKRQMLNDRREQKEKEIKAKSKVVKAPRKTRNVSQNKFVTSTSNRAVASLGGDAAISGRADVFGTERRSSASVQQSPLFTVHMSSHILSPIGTPAVNVDSVSRSNNLKSSQPGSVANLGVKLVAGLSTENKNMVLDGSSASLGSWGSADISQQVMALTQTQLDEAMKPARFDSHVTSSIALEPVKPLVSTMTQEKPFLLSSSPLNSLLAGEKIQFGAVTSPTILPLASRIVSNGIGPGGSCRSDISVDRNLALATNNCTLLFDKEKHPDDSRGRLEDSEAEAEAEAEAAASAVAVAAISSDEIVGIRSSETSAPISKNKSFSAAAATGLPPGGIATSREVSGQSVGEESFTVALPADLSVDTPVPLWPPLPSPQSSSGSMLSHFPGAPPSQFPCFEMNPVLGAPIFAFGPHDEAAGTQAQPQRNTMLGPGPPAAWPQCHSGVDSFYGSPAGFTGPFISPGGIPGVQGPPHMVVYNHFTPVGQFGQVGVGFMSTFIPTGKQPDWKHNPLSTSVSVSEGDVSSLNVASGQRNSPSMPAPIQHLASGSSLMPMGSPLAMFDMSPFQPSADIQVQARWPHLPAPPHLHALPLPLPVQQPHLEGGISSKFSPSQSVENSAGNNHFNQSHTSTTTSGNRSVTLPGDAASQFPDELLLVEPATSVTSTTHSMKPSYITMTGSNNKGSRSSKNFTRSTVANPSESGGNTIHHSVGPPPPTKPQASQQCPLGQQYLHPLRYADQRGNAAPQKTGSGSEWHRRMGFHGRNQSSGQDKNYTALKVKQVYVAKLPTNGPATPS